MPAWRGRSPLGVPFARSKGTKTRLGRSPLRTSLGYESSLNSARDPCCGPCFCHHTRPTLATGPMAGWFPCPGLPWRSGVSAAGSQPPISWEQRLTRERPWQQKDTLAEKKIQAIERHVIYVTQPNQGPNREGRRDTQYRGVDSTRRGRPRLWRSLVTFWRQKVTPAERPCQGADLRLGHGRASMFTCKKPK